MGAFIAKQPNGLYCRFSTVVDCVTHYDMTEIRLHISPKFRSHLFFGGITCCEHLPFSRHLRIVYTLDCCFPRMIYMTCRNDYDIRSGFPHEIRVAGILPAMMIGLHYCNLTDKVGDITLQIAFFCRRAPNITAIEISEVSILHPYGTAE